MCIDEYKNSCWTDDSESVYYCPMCREPITNEIFELILDTHIVEIVFDFPECELKNDWIRRRKEIKVKKDSNKCLQRDRISLGILAAFAIFTCSHTLSHLK